SIFVFICLSPQPLGHKKPSRRLRRTMEIGKVASWSATFKYFFGVPCRRSEATCPAESGI
ncbi:MAG: hypothetical protein R6T98_16680, partial [Desulfatiglandales bacterium]